MGEAAVALVVAEVDGSPSILLIRRARREGDPWSGDVALPGGRRSPADCSLLETAVRECWEETGVDLSGIEPTATLGPFRSCLDPEVTVWAFVFRLPGRPETSLGDEIEEAFWAPISELAASKRHFEVGGRVREAYVWRGRVVWGLTRRILDRALPLLSGGVSAEPGSPPRPS